MKRGKLMAKIFGATLVFVMVWIMLGGLPGSIAAADETATEAWVARYDCAGKGADFAEAMAIDGSGNIFVTGTSQGDFATVKYDNAGNQLWVSRYDSPVSYPWSIEDDKAKAIAVDESGNVYVTGESMGQDTGWDYATVKYDANGNELWTTRYEGIPLPGNQSSEDYAAAIAVDGFGHVYVAGTSRFDFCLIKYDGNTGEPLWTSVYDDPTAQCDSASAIAIDTSGNVYVTGWSVQCGYATVKYDSAGNQSWVAKLPNADAMANAIAVDDSGNVYVTGHCGGDGYGTVKYDSAGNELWVSYHRTYNIAEAYAIAVDSIGNVYVTGRDQVGGVDYDDYDYATIKYDSAGNQTWVRYYDGPTNGADLAYALVLDAANDVYVAGVSEGIDTSSDYAIVKYDNDGNELWVARYNGPANSDDEAHGMAMDVSGNVYVTGYAFTSSKQDYTTNKYNANGSLLWSAHYDAGVGGQEEAADMAVDGSGNVYVTGQSQGDYATVKYDSAGNQLWATRYESPGAGIDSPNAIAVDNLGNVYVTGQSEAYMWDCITVKYDGYGNQIWAVRYDGGETDSGFKVAVDQSGNVYVTGLSFAGSYHYITIKYDTNGNELWARLFDSTGHGYAATSASDMAIDASGNIYVTGAGAVADSDWAYVTVKYDSAGNELWVARYDSPVKVWDWARAIRVDNMGNVFVTGTSGLGMVPGSENDYATVKYDSAGNQLWVARYDSPSSGEDDGQDIAIDDSGNVYVTGISGYTWGSEGMEPVGGDYATIKYDSAGNELWVRTYDGPAGGSDSGQAVALDDIGDIYVTGSSWVSGTYENPNTDYATVKYDSAGNQLWVARYDSGVSGFEAAKAVALDESGSVYITGSSCGDGTHSDYATIKYVQTIEPGGLCFIATAAYGTPMADEVQTLRAFRDRYLLTNPLGQAFVHFYYKVSPPVAEFITHHPGLKPIVRVGLVPVVAVSTVVANTSAAEKIAMLGLLVLVSAAVAIWAARGRGRGSEQT
jgi:uncharacterized delta-60 repeat protein